MLTELEQQAVLDRLEGWELVEFLQISIDQILAIALDNDWINGENLEDFLDFIGMRN